MTFDMHPIPEKRLSEIERPNGWRYKQQNIKIQNIRTYFYRNRNNNRKKKKLKVYVKVIII